MTEIEQQAIKAGWERCGDIWRRPVRHGEPGSLVKNRREWVVGSAREAIEIDTPSRS